MNHSGLAASRYPIFLMLALSWPSTSALAGGMPAAARVPVEEMRLDNGMKLLLVPQPQSSTVAAGWMVGVGSADDQPDKTGLSHLLEHMLFKGTRTVGARELEIELDLLDQVDGLWAQRLELETKLAAANPSKRRKLVRRLDEVSTRLTALQRQASALAHLGHFSYLYSAQGAAGLNANTYRDLTMYFVTVPGERLELWFWLESDRLLEPVFREFYKEVQVVHEERRLRIESTPTGALDEELRARFWGEHPYGWDPQGSADHLDRTTRQDARELFRRQYRADNLTAALVGGFDIEQVKAWARLYFGRLPGGWPSPTSTPPALETRTTEDRFSALCNCPPQARILYPSAAFDHPDSYALQLLSAVLNGRTGRLYRSLVVDQEIAFSAYTQQTSWKRAGQFAFRGESKGGEDPEALVRAWDRQLTLLETEPITLTEMERARNRLTADAFRSLKEPSALMKQLLIYAGLGDWRYLNRWTDRIREVKAQDLERVASSYLRPELRTIALYRRAARDAGRPVAEKGCTAR